MCATPRPSPSCGRRCAAGSTLRRSSPPTTRRSTAACCMPAASGTGCGRRGRGSPAPCSSPARNGESGRRSCPTSAGGSIYRYGTTTPERTRWRAPASCSRPKRMAGGTGSVEHAGRSRGRSYALHSPPRRRDGRNGCTGRPSGTGWSHGGGDCRAAQQVCASVDSPLATPGVTPCGRRSTVVLRTGRGGGGRDGIDAR